MNKNQAIKDIKLVIRYSNAVSGSCHHAYLGGHAHARLMRILGGEYGSQDPAHSYDALLDAADDDELTEARAYVDHLIDKAREHLGTSDREEALLNFLTDLMEGTPIDERNRNDDGLRDHLSFAERPSLDWIKGKVKRYHDILSGQ